MLLQVMQKESWLEAQGASYESGGGGGGWGFWNKIYMV